MKTLKNMKGMVGEAILVLMAMTLAFCWLAQVVANHAK